MPIKLSFMPEEGMITNYYDCKAVAPDGSHWESCRGRWLRGWDGIDGFSWHLSVRKLPRQFNMDAFVFGLFALFSSMALSGHAIRMVRPDLPVWPALPIVLAFNFLCGFVAYRKMR